MKIFIAGGGSGGHIYPALSIAKSLQARHPSAQIEFVGTAQGLESKIIPKEGYTLHLIESGKFNYKGRVFAKIKTLFKAVVGVLQSLNLLIKHKPDFVIGVGGYASAPMMLAATMFGTKTAIWEPNAYPGMANRVLSRFVDKSYVVFPEAQKLLKTKDNETVGMPLRYKPEEIKDHFKEKKSDRKFTVLCFGGSQGSVFLNDKISDVFLNNQDIQKNLRLIHQTGPKDFERMKQKYGQLENVEVHEYIYNMPDYYVQSDVMFCRGGANTLAEAALFGVVPIIVPIPAADNHQEKNADSLVKKNAAFMFLQDQFSDVIFERLLWNLFKEPHIVAQISTILRSTVPSVNASDRIAEDIIERILKR